MTLLPREPIDDGACRWARMNALPWHLSWDGLRTLCGVSLEDSKLQQRALRTGPPPGTKCGVCIERIKIQLGL